MTASIAAFLLAVGCIALWVVYDLTVGRRRRAYRRRRFQENLEQIFANAAGVVTQSLPAVDVRPGMLLLHRGERLRVTAVKPVPAGTEISAHPDGAPTLRTREILVVGGRNIRLTIDPRATKEPS